MSREKRVFSAIRVLSAIRASVFGNSRYEKIRKQVLSAIRKQNKVVSAIRIQKAGAIGNSDGRIQKQVLSAIPWREY